jgi:hypothetical protein
MQPRGDGQLQVTSSDPAKAPGKEMRDKRAYFLTLLGFAAGLFSWGYFVIAPSPSIYFGSVLLAIALTFCAIAFWEYCDWRLRTKVSVLTPSLIILSTLGLQWVAFETRPSFAFIVPGVVLGNNSWDFIINHRGPKTSESVEILFTDDDKKKAVLSERPQGVTPQDISTYTKILNYPEVNPNGAGHFFALQFQWTPSIFDHEHYTMEITDRNHRNIHQELQIEFVNGESFWATQITENGKQLLDCKDAGFPYGSKAPIPCFPKVTGPGY